ncbi:hypothetical protein Tco_0461193, partial [Tanacetum coccineum]
SILSLCVCFVISIDYSIFVVENTNPPPTLDPPVLPTTLYVKVVQELDKLQAISAYIDSRLENIEHFFNGFVNPPNEIDIDDLEPGDESVDTPLVSPFRDSDDDYDDGEVLNKLEEYGNAGKLCRKKIINNIDEDDLAFPCMIGLRKFVAYFDPFLPMKIITCKAYNTKMVEGLESTGRNLVAIVKVVYIFVGSLTYVIDFVVLKDIGEFIVSNMAEVVMGKPFRNVTQIEYDCVKGLVSFTRILDNYTFQMPRTIPRFKNWGYASWSRIPPIHVLSKMALMNGFKNFHEKNKLMYENCLNRGPEYQVDENMKEWLICGHALRIPPSCVSLLVCHIACSLPESFTSDLPPVPLNTKVIVGDEGLAAGDEGPSMRVESLTLGGDESVPEGQPRAAAVVETAVGEPLGLGYEALRHQEIALEEGRMPSVFEPTLTTCIDMEDGIAYIDVPAYPPPAPPAQTPPSPEWSPGLLPISPIPYIVHSPISSPMIPLTVPSPVALPTTAETEGFLTELGARVEMQGGLIRDHTVRLEELSPALFERYDRDIGELFIRSGAVRDQIFSQRYRFRSLEHKQERVVVTFGAIWRPILTLESWTGQTEAQRAAMWHTNSDTQKENRELRLQFAEERRARLDLAEIVDSMRRGQEPRGDV